MHTRFAFTVTLLFLFIFSNAQKEKPVLDSADYYDELFGELENFIDSLTAPRTMFMISIGANGNFINAVQNNSGTAIRNHRFMYMPSLGYYHKDGLGVNASVSVVNDGKNFNPFQFSVTGSYDYLKNISFMAGIGFTRFFTKDSLSFYTSPLKNEASAYFTLRKWGIKPGISATYGWGSRTDTEEREEYISLLRLRTPGYTQVSTTENVSDFSLSASLRKDFYWLDFIGKKTFLRLTPQISFTSGTQQFGFNQTSNSYAMRKGTGVNVLYNSENVHLDDELKFQPLSLTSFIKTELSIGKFFIQPQVVFDYYFPAQNNNFTTGFRFNTGFIF